VAGTLAPRPAPRAKPAHLMCRNRFWGVIGAGASIYFAYLAYIHIRDADFLWPHTWWSTLTYAVWAVLAFGLLSETRCWRERIFFALVFLDLVVGLVFLLWNSAPLNYARHAREAVFYLWILAALASLTTLARPQEKAKV
jgi:hypothetical protein